MGSCQGSGVIGSHGLQGRRLSGSAGVNEEKLGGNQGHRVFKEHKSECNGLVQGSMKKNFEAIRVTEGSMR